MLTSTTLFVSVFPMALPICSSRSETFASALSSNLVEKLSPLGRCPCMKNTVGGRAATLSLVKSVV